MDGGLGERGLEDGGLEDGGSKGEVLDGEVRVILSTAKKVVRSHLSVVVY